jgi:predicted SAM-dependent methyltransferase
MKSYEIGKIKKNYYDYVIAFYSLEHLDNLEETVKLIYNILNKKGKLIIAIPN